MIAIVIEITIVQSFVIATNTGIVTLSSLRKITIVIVTGTVTRSIAADDSKWPPFGEAILHQELITRGASGWDVPMNERRNGMRAGALV
jgi:hypothetical protein